MKSFLWKLAWKLRMNRWPEKLDYWTCDPKKEPWRSGEMRKFLHKLGIHIESSLSRGYIQSSWRKDD